MGITDLEEQFSFYASYHHSGINKWIHIFCVWPILWSAFVLAQYIPIELSFIPTGGLYPPNLTLLASIFYAGVYIVMDKRAGSLGAILVFASLITSRRFYLDGGVWGLPAWQVAAALHVAGWIAQFIGHGVFEGRAPALLDNMMQAFVMAPLFVLLEVLFFFGYRKDFQRTMWARVNKNVAAFKASTKSKKIGTK